MALDVLTFQLVFHLCRSYMPNHLFSMTTYVASLSLFQISSYLLPILMLYVSLLCTLRTLYGHCLGELIYFLNYQGEVVVPVTYHVSY